MQPVDGPGGASTRRVAVRTIGALCVVAMVLGLVAGTAPASAGRATVAAQDPPPAPGPCPTTKAEPGCYVDYAHAHLTVSPTSTDLPQPYPGCSGSYPGAKETPNACQQVTLTLSVDLPYCATYNDVGCIVGVDWGSATAFERWADGGAVVGPNLRWLPLGGAGCPSGAGSCNEFFLIGTPDRSGWMIIRDPVVDVRLADPTSPDGLGYDTYRPETAVYIVGPGGRPPVASFTVDADPATRGRYLFTDTSTDPDGDTLSVQWDFGDGTTGSGSGVAHTFGASGSYTVTERVTDPAGHQDVATRNVQVSLGSFRYEMPPRFGLDANHDGQIDYPTTPDEVTPPDGFDVNLIVDRARCDDATFAFTADGVPLDVTRDGCTFATKLDEGSYEVSLSIDGADQGTETVKVDDILIVAMGDSYSSGEGNPESGAAPWRDNKSQCHRSANAGPARAALAAEKASKQTSVTFVHLACSGATIADGLLGPQPFTTDPSGFDQLAEFDRLIHRHVDALTLSIGANDVGFGPILSYCAVVGDAQDGCDAHYYDYVTVREGLANALAPGYRNPNPIETSICDATIAGETTLSAGISTSLLDRSVTEALLLMRDGKDWNVYLNPGGWNYDGADRTERFGIAGPPSKEGASSCEQISKVGVKIPLDAPLAQSFPRAIGVPETRPGGLLGYPEVEPLVPVVEITPPSLEEWVGRRVGQLPADLATLRAQIDARVDPSSVYLMEYMNPVTGNDGEVCDAMLAPPFGTGVAKDEATWAWDHVLTPLNRALRDEAGAAGWNYVGGLEADFVGHGYCATGNRWVETLDESATGQGDPYGAMHPNATGSAVIGAKLFDAFDGTLDLRPGPAAPGDGRTIHTELVEPARVGDTELAVASDDGFGVGDAVLIDAGTDREERGLVAGFGSIILVDPVGYPHDAGARIVSLGPAQVPPSSTTTTTTIGPTTTTTAPTASGPSSAAPVSLSPRFTG